MRLPAEVTTITTISILTCSLLLAGVEADSGSWLSYTWGQAKHAGREAGNALYKGVKELACLQVRCTLENIRIIRSPVLGGVLQPELAAS